MGFPADKITNSQGASVCGGWRWTVGADATALRSLDAFSATEVRGLAGRAREGAAQIIPIETVRSQVVAAVGLPPHEARERVFLIDEVSALQPAAANALLKTPEEPPARTRVILMTIAPDQLLPSTRSADRGAWPWRPWTATV